MPRPIVLLATCALIVFALQYPLSTTFPIGGDAASYITKSQHLENLWTSRYPTAHLLLRASVVLPMEWPDRFVWMMALGHIATGVTLAWLVWCFTKNPLACAAALFFWGLSATGIQQHFQDATFAQLWSLPWFLLWLESLYSRAWWRSIPLLLLTITTHPFTGLLAIMISILFLIQLAGTKEVSAADKKPLLGMTGVTLMLALLITSILFLRPTVIRDNTDHLVIGEAIRSTYGAQMLLALVGVVYTLRKLRHDTIGRSLIVAGILATAWLAFNDNFGVGVETKRFATYFFVGVSISAAWATPWVLRRALPWRVPRFLVGLLLASAMFVGSWNGGAIVYRFYESPSRYARLHVSEQTAFRALADILPADSTLVSSEANRHGEWLPIVTGKQWFAIPDSDPVWQGGASEWKQFARENHYTHLVVLKHTEAAPLPIQDSTDLFPVVYANTGVTVYRLL